MGQHDGINYDEGNLSEDQYEQSQHSPSTVWYMRFLQADGTYTQSHKIPPELIPEDLQNATDELVDRANSHMKKSTEDGK